ncbi:MULTISPECIES: CRISPR-associated endonuclease Cas2 [Aerococcus]|uniref:CRISPR-associated endoribonuclease Cas2 n=2 Tax=Aerococcus TaxID=1375 RepID=A0A178HD98_9LACT|nr:MULTISPECIES: CRISPR-associated endonuclease Cas2 [Aerococcus]KAA9218316.1 CRISPR-associated endonuclease Cas2 [Aerococcus loyolae]KAA9264253.1 CRISPR-associated endonuclease Cas2 [Aerococcus loyolae]MCY3026389.1 CRISPR-associated endonuclease Cas2 [Aerococcus loyolae]MCY3027899.1 CRISPR-associated endonuclease Cas2 [Aerococcus loyolae]MCY3029845.1 CRISPR-associated endonuclease Cas2 [Aerococcus loyolae]
MMVLITYDVNTESKAGQKRLRKVAKVCVDYGQRVQNSVFECSLDPGQLALVKSKLDGIIDSEVDSIRFYNLGKNWDHRVQTLGRDDTYHPEKDVLLL